MAAKKAKSTKSPAGQRKRSGEPGGSDPARPRSRKSETAASDSPQEDSQDGAATDGQTSPHTDPNSPEFLVVGIGASAGGLEAFIELLEHLPGDTGMAFVLVQHLDPRHKSNLAEILARSTQMSIREVTDGLPVEPDHIYVVPPNMEMGMLHGVLKLMPRAEPHGRHMPINSFLRSLAEDQGPRAIGVVLSGTGSDGALGLRAIKAEGGITIAQDQASAKYGGMPGAAVATGDVDCVLSVADIGRELARIGRHPHFARNVRPIGPQPARPEHEAIDKVFLMLRRATGVDFTYYKRSTVERRICRRMVLHKVERLEHYVKYLQENPQEVQALFEDMLINVTSFFRDPATFDALKKTVLPLILRDKPSDAPLRVWVPGCSTGEEAYSIAIALMEYMSEAEASSAVQIFATDVSETAIEKARAGKYPESIAGDVSPERLRRYFSGADGGYQVSKTIRDMCVFARQNVIKDPPFSQIDLLSCRNLLIYLGPEFQKKVIPAFHYALKPGGCLMLGSSETIGGFPELFSLVDRKHKIYSKKSARTRPALEFGVMDFMPKPHAQPERSPTVHRSPADLQREADRYVLSRYAPCGVIVDEHLEILHFRGETGCYLAPSPGEASLNLLKMAREGLLLELRAVIHRARKENASVRKDGLKVKSNGGFVPVDLEVIPLVSEREPAAHYLVLFHEGQPAQSDSRSGEKSAGRSRPQQGESDEIHRLREELASTKESLQAIIEEHEATNEELRAANEEIQSANEELQSTNEELETAKEELQSTNEELTTLNEELENRNAELAQAINDLNNLLTSANIPIVMLCRNLRIRMFTPVAEKVLGLRSSDIGRPVGELNLGLGVENLEEQVADVIRSLETRELRIVAPSGTAYPMRIRPYRTADDKIEGAVLALMETHER